jgi:hypothetical protein
MTLISPTYVPGVSALAFALTVIFVGVLQHPPPDGVMTSQFPPLPDAAIGVKRMTAPVLAIDITWGAGFTPCVVLKVTVGS